MNPIAATTLHSTADGSDKVYTIAIVPNPDGGFDVVAENGKRGGTQTQQAPKAVGVSETDARKAYEKLIREKVARKYNPLDGDAAAVAARNARDGRSAGIPVMLLNSINEAEFFALLSPAQRPPWLLQEKKDGERRLIVIRNGDVAGTNRKGEFVPLAQSIARLAHFLGDDTVIDGEQVGDAFFAFDAQRINGEDLTHLGFEDRFLALAALCEASLPNPHPSFQVLPVSDAAPDIMTLVPGLRDAGSEGFVLKKRDSAYTDGRPSTGGNALKFKFYNTATVEIVGHNAVHSVRMGLYDNGLLIERGSVTIPQGTALPEIGTFAEVRYRYANRGGSIYEPSWIAARTDVGRAACEDSQLAFKGDGIPA